MTVPALPTKVEIQRMFKRIELDRLRQHGFKKMPDLPPAELVTPEKIASARKELMEVVNSTAAASLVWEGLVDPTVKYCKVQSRLGLWEHLANKYHDEDASCWMDWLDGLECVGECICPESWEKRLKKDNKLSLDGSFKQSKAVLDIMDGKHKKPAWPQDQIQKVWDVSLEEAQIVPELGYPMLMGPCDVIKGEECVIENAKKRRKVESEKKRIALDIVAVDVAKCYKNMIIKASLPAMMDKTSFGTDMEVLGMQYNVEGSVPVLEVTEKKKKQIVETCDKFIDEGVINEVDLDSFLGHGQW
eukprot:g15220.t1